jgi:hypothetical protein
MFLGGVVAGYWGCPRRCWSCSRSRWRARDAGCQASKLPSAPPQDGGTPGCCTHRDQEPGTQPQLCTSLKLGYSSPFCQRKEELRKAGRGQLHGTGSSLCWPHRPRCFPCATSLHLQCPSNWTPARYEMCWISNLRGPCIKFAIFLDWLIIIKRLFQTSSRSPSRSLSCWRRTQSMSGANLVMKRFRHWRSC